jgi:NADH-quinone oxidoreductase subunit A
MSNMPAQAVHASNVDVTFGVLLFAAAACGMVLAILLLGALIRPKVYNPDKAAIYECGEPAIGKGQIQFDLRFYAVALVFIVFDVEIALFYPWAVVFGGGGFEQASAEFLRQLKAAALWDMLFFFAVVVVGFLYLWKYGYLDWVRALGGRPESAETPDRLASDAERGQP